MRRRNAALEDEPYEEELPGTDPLIFPGPVGPIEGEEGYAILDGLTNLGDRLVDKLDSNQEALSEQIGTGFERTGELITDGFNQEAPPPGPGGGGPPAGGGGGGGRNQLPDRGELRELRARKNTLTGRIKELKRGKEDRQERRRIGELKERRENVREEIQDVRQQGTLPRETTARRAPAMHFFHAPEGFAPITAAITRSTPAPQKQASMTRTPAKAGPVVKRPAIAARRR